MAISTIISAIGETVLAQIAELLNYVNPILKYLLDNKV